MLGHDIEDIINNENAAKIAALENRMKGGAPNPEQQIGFAVAFRDNIRILVKNNQGRLVAAPNQ